MMKRKRGRCAAIPKSVREESVGSKNGHYEGQKVGARLGGGVGERVMTVGIG